MPNREPRKRNGLIGLIAGIGASMVAQAAVAADLTVTIADLRSARGEVHIALYDDARAFPKDGRYIANKTVPANAAVAVFAGLAPGTYAIATYHDENGNGDFDRGLLGLPLEGYGFSNDAHAVFGPPDFEDAGFQVEETGTHVTIRMINW